MVDLRLRSQLPHAAIEPMLGKLVTANEFDVVLTGDASVRKPDGSLLCVYRRGVMTEALDAAYPVLTTLRNGNDNRGLASGTVRKRKYATNRTYSKKIMSNAIGALDPSGQRHFCRLTAWTGHETEKFVSLYPLFQEVGRRFGELVPDRHSVQMDFIRRTDPAWVIKGTPFTTITVNNTYPTGVHTDQGDLDEGFSCLAVIRRGDYTGGFLTFPQYRVAVDMQHGDLLLMDAHAYHGNTNLVLGDGAERISLVAYYRTRLVECGTAEAEHKRSLAIADKRLGIRA